MSEKEAKNKRRGDVFMLEMDDTVGGVARGSGGRRKKDAGVGRVGGQHTDSAGTNERSRSAVELPAYKAGIGRKHCQNKRKRTVIGQGKLPKFGWRLQAAYLSAETRPSLSAFGFREIIVGVATGQRFCPSISLALWDLIWKLLIIIIDRIG
ncbi:hypothetical protein IFM47457_06889 [Aspergillus lentulus]|nr:hypothetical protein IFM47457_06889 [Aspergillus lentulus]